MCQFSQGDLREKRGPELNLALYAKTELGRVYAELGKLKDAEEMYKEAREKLQIAVGPEHLGIYITDLYLGELYECQDKLCEAEKMFYAGWRMKERWG
jgi:hypothetical protein